MIAAVTLSGAISCGAGAPARENLWPRIFTDLGLPIDALVSVWFGEAVLHLPFGTVPALFCQRETHI